jgi:hypothetical protein
METRNQKIIRWFEQPKLRGSVKSRKQTAEKPKTRNRKPDTVHKPGFDPLTPRHFAPTMQLPKPPFAGICYPHYMRTFIFIVLIALFLVSAGRPANAETCEPTRPDSLGPFYTPGAPERSKVGEGYVLIGEVRSASDCSILKGALIELWLTGPDGRYDDEHRATVFSEESGSYRFECNFPPAYYGRPPHIHIRVSADGYRTLVTQHYPESGTSEGTFDLILTPGR